MIQHPAFSSLIYEFHSNKKQGKAVDIPSDFERKESVWMNFMGLGKFETLSFLYMDCRNYEHFHQWITDLKGINFIAQATLDFNAWTAHQTGTNNNAPGYPETLSQEQLQFWETHGFLRIPGVVEDEICDLVKEEICKCLSLDMENPQTWHPRHSDLQGIMLQLYQNEAMEKIRYHKRIKEISAELYQTDQLIATTEKVGYNPPEIPGWTSRNGSLHWDLNLAQPLKFHIQGLVYLNEVPEKRGPLQVVPGFQHRFEDWMKPFDSLESAQKHMLETEKAIPVSGEKGDLILWQSTLPHSAGRNQCTFPRFVQYVSFAKL